MSPEDTNAARQKATILLVDDNPQVRSFIRPALEDNGFNCIEAADGDEAVYQAQESRPDLIVLDIELGDPAMDSCDRVKGQLHRLPPHDRREFGR